jgi:hypothetical protein
MISSRTIAICSAVTALGMTMLMPGSDSLWIDEAQTFHHMAQPTLSALCLGLLADHKSEALMPLGMFVAWLGGQLVGMSEWQMRAPNILWAALAVLAFVRLGKLWRAPWAPLLLATQPFLWFYANEARPYAFQIGCGAWLAAGCAEVLQSRRLDARSLDILLVASAALVASTLFGMVTVGAVAVVLGMLWRRERWLIVRGARARIALGALWCAAFGAYYVWRVASGAKGAKIWDVGLQNLGFALYEFAGFSGFGPGRDELRELARTRGAAGAVDGLAAYLIWIVLLSLLLAAVGVMLRAAWQEGEWRREIAFYAAVCALVGGTTLALALVARFPFWGRHLAPAFPFYCALLVLGLGYIQRTNLPAVVRLGVLASLLALLAFSSAQLRWSPRHAKDDYRSAVASAVSALRAGRDVWWSASPEAAAYYGLAVSKGTRQPGKATFLSLDKPEQTAILPVPDVIIISKRDIYDPIGQVGRLITAKQFRPTKHFKAFTVWER